ncbi:hypothetical protein RRF57_012694 [Xylaria bambusicola]|uniref:Uncharacterized protein n=1 Tax=Xylaria bambusicola TaxID=326684 RepID=A0AAN7ZAZ7_9PEZI
MSLASMYVDGPCLRDVPGCHEWGVTAGSSGDRNISASGWTSDRQGKARKRERGQRLDTRIVARTPRAEPLSSNRNEGWRSLYARQLRRRPVELLDTAV